MELKRDPMFGHVFPKELPDKGIVRIVIREGVEGSITDTGGKG